MLGVLAGVAYLAGSVVCHQLPERSFALGGHQWPVCARCSGLYLGAALGLAAWLALRRWGLPRLDGRRNAVTLVAVVALPTAVSWATGVLGFWDGTNVIRAALALPLGLTVGGLAAAVTARDLR